MFLLVCLRFETSIPFTHRTVHGLISGDAMRERNRAVSKFAMNVGKVVHQPSDLQTSVQQLNTMSAIGAKVVTAASNAARSFG